MGNDLHFWNIDFFSKNLLRWTFTHYRKYKIDSVSFSFHVFR